MDIENYTNFRRKFEGYREKISAILKWATNKPSFDTKFVLSVKKSLEEYENLTEKQKDAIDNIIKKFGIKFEVNTAILDEEIEE